jgi:mono/diheme cytochrome c family protein
MMFVRISLQELAGVLVACSILTSNAAAQDNKAPQNEDKPHQVVDGYKVDANIMNGFRAWRASACDRCHGANQQGLVGPSLIDSFKTLSMEEFKKTVIEGRPEKGMPSFQESKTVTENLAGLYAYLKGRSNGDITRSRVEELK